MTVPTPCMNVSCQPHTMGVAYRRSLCSCRWDGRDTLGELGNG